MPDCSQYRHCKNSFNGPDHANSADVLVTEVTNTDDVIGLMKRNEAWQAKSNLRQEHVKLVRSAGRGTGPPQDSRDDAPEPVI